MSCSLWIWSPSYPIRDPATSTPDEVTAIPFI